MLIHVTPDVEKVSISLKMLSPARPLVHGYVPVAPEVGNCRGIPPVPVELSVSKSQQLASNVQVRMEVAVEERQPCVRFKYRVQSMIIQCQTYDVVWQRQLERAVNQPSNRRLLARDGVAHCRHNPLHGKFIHSISRL